MNKENRKAAQERRRKERERKNTEKKALKITLIALGSIIVVGLVTLIVVSQVRTNIANKQAEESQSAYESSVEASKSESESAYIASSEAASELVENGELNTDPELVAEDGDIVNIDYIGYLDGEAFEGGSAEGSDLTLGSGTFIDGFESGIVGHSAGDTFDLNLTFPENYGNTNLAGKDVVFTVTLNGIYK